MIRHSIYCCFFICALCLICLSCSREEPEPAATEQPFEAVASEVSDSKTQSNESSPKEISKPSLPQAPNPPTRPSPLEVPGFNPASHVGPDDAQSWPRSVTVVLHGNFDRPEWECDTWKRAAGFHGWVLCPRGVRTPYATIQEDRWTYKGRASVQREIESALKALTERYPGRVSLEEMVLVGFSLGSIYASRLAVENPGRYEYLFLVEGGVEKLDRKLLRSLKKSGIRAIGMAMSAPGRRARAKSLVGLITARGMRAVFVDMKGAGHGYSRDFAVHGRAALKKLLYAQPQRDAGMEAR